MNAVHEELESLLADWDAGVLDDIGIRRVREILRTDAVARTVYLRHQMIGAALQLEAESGLALPAEPATTAAGDDTPDPAGAWRSSAAGPRRLATVSLAVAALVAVSMLAARWLYLEAGLRQRTASAAATPAGDELTPAPGTDSRLATANATNQPDVRGTEQRGAESGRAGAAEATSHGVAQVARLVDVVWSPEQTPLQVGDAVSPGPLRLVSGYAQIEFFCGATVILEGPAELDLKSATLARVRRGQLRAHVPPAARGFSLEVDDLKVVDLGTEFGLSVTPEGADVQVFDGEVELQRPRQESRRISAGHAVSRGISGAFSDAAATPERFLDIATLNTHVRREALEAFERWRGWSARTRRDPRLIAYYAFDQTNGRDRRLASSLEPANSELDGAIVGARRVQGRWPSKGGLEFKRPGDRVRVQIPGEYQSLTLACWVRIDSLDRWYNSLFLTDNYNQGEPHWQILDTGQLFFSVRSRPDRQPGEPPLHGPAHHPVVSPSFWQPSMSGKWLHLATTYDASAGRTTHFLDGRVLHSEVLPENLRVATTRIGTASIGNWSLPTKPDAEFAIRNLNGSMDEFMVFAAALEADEIKTIYENGRP